MTANLRARLLGGFDAASLSQIEDAGLNASAPPQQRWLDGWILRFSPGKAQRARCINAVAIGKRSLEHKLAECVGLFNGWGLPLLVRITPFTQPIELDDLLQARGWEAYDDTRVMVLPVLAGRTPPAVAAGISVDEVDSQTFAEVVGTFRESSPDARQAHAERLRVSPVPYRGFVLREGGAMRACGQIAVEGPWAGLYDVHTDTAARGRGLASALCEHLLLQAALNGAAGAYLQVGAENHTARRIYARMGFEDGYSYHYRRPV